ncbi:hypothetical protein BCR44DRAFT_72221 [Catenaria anguillulae PL171]|uniref:Uncharacterized protein n=1 Tax=Catenaria anguillulae PL171 TaxID=765915 RepID=A0A1Y2HTS2_9FUNG|nr:hypothetical protein BCR44DRAFT_72221 [Catenaria anguillulae PL171]
MPFTIDPAYGGSAAHCAGKPATVALAPTASAAVTDSDGPADISDLQALLALDTDEATSNPLETNAATSNVLEDDPSRWSSLGYLASSGDQSILHLNQHTPPPGGPPSFQHALSQLPGQPPLYMPPTFSHALPAPFMTISLASAASLVPPSGAPAEPLAKAWNMTTQTAVSTQDQTADVEQVPVVTAVKVISDQLAKANTKHGKNKNPRQIHDFQACAWDLVFIKDKVTAKHMVELCVPIRIDATAPGLIDLDWKAALILESQVNKGVDLNELVAGLDWSLLNGVDSAVVGEITQTQKRTIELDLAFSVVPRKRHVLVIVVNGVVCKGVPRKITVECDRNKRDRGTAKRKADAQASEEDDEADIPELSPAPVAKRVKMANPAAEHVEGLPASVAPLTPPASPQCGSHMYPEVALLRMIEQTDMFDPSIFDVIRDGKFQAEVIHKATGLLIELHIRAGASSTWAAEQIVETFAQLGRHADLLRQHSWTSSVPHPYPLHALANCARPELVDLMLDYLYPRQVRVPAPGVTTCLQSFDVDHNHMTCDLCRAFATTLALSRFNSDGRLPIHSAAWKKNSVFVMHHLRIMGAKSTFATANRRDGDFGNFFHATCGSKSAVDWLEKLWCDVIVLEADRKVVAHALRMEDDRGRTPFDMATYQFEKRKETANRTK